MTATAMRPARKTTKATPAKAAPSIRKVPTTTPLATSAPKVAKGTLRPESHPERRASSGQGKAGRLAEALKPFGWEVKTKVCPGDRVEVTAKRGADTLRLVWVDGGYEYGTALKSGNSSRKLRNLSEAIRLCALKVDAK